MRSYFIAVEQTLLRYRQEIESGLKLRIEELERNQRGLDVLFVFKTNHIAEVESCVKALLRKNRYRKYKEVYEADIDIIKEAIHGCEALCRRVTNLPMKRQRITSVGGGVFEHFLVIDKA